MANDAAQAVLAPLSIPDSVKADAWDAYHQASDQDSLAGRLRTIKGLSDDIRANLWDAKAADLKGASATPASNPPKQQTASDLANWRQGAPIAVDRNAPPPPEALEAMRARQQGPAQQQPPSLIRQLGKAVSEPLLPLPSGQLDTPLRRFANLEQNFGSPTTAGIANFAAGGTEDLARLGSAATSPASIGLAAASGGTSIPMRLITTAGALGYGGYGAAQALKSQQPGESDADYWQRVLYGSAMAVGGAAGTADQVRTTLGNHFVKVYGLSSDYADQVADQVKQINSVRQTGAQDVLQAKGNLQKLQQQRVETGRQILADAAQAVQQEHARVQEPFAKIGQKITEPVSDAGSIQQIVNDSAKKFGAKPEEIPSAALRALSPEEETAGPRALTANELQMANAISKTPQWQSMSTADLRQQLPNLGYAPKQIDAILSVARPGEVAQGGAVSFNDLTRVREDLYGAAQSAKDTAVKNALFDAHDKITTMQENSAKENGMGVQYQLAKRDYMQFRRSAGSGLMNDFLSAKDVEDQALTPKIAQLTNKSTAEALRTVLKPLGVDVSPLDQIVGDIGEAKQNLKGMPKELAAKVKGMQQRGQIVPGKNVEDLTGMSNQQLNEARINAILKSSRARGIPNPGGLVMLLYGTLTGRMFPALYGATRLTLPQLVKSETFQRMAMEQSGVLPGTAKALALKRGLAALAPTLSNAIPAVKPAQ